MPDIKTMFPSKYLSFGDLEIGRNYEGTIKAVTLEQVNVRGGYGGRRGGFGADQADAEPSWLLFFHEFQKPIKLKKTRAEKIGIVLGSSNTDHWIGKRLRFYRGAWTNGGQSGEGLMIDDRPFPTPAPATLPGGSPLVTLDRRAIPQEAMDRFFRHLREKGKTWDDFLAWAKNKAPEAYTLTWGVSLDAIPAGVLPAMKAHLDAIAAPPAEVIDRATGEVMKPGGPLAGEVIPDDDIPF